MRWTSGHRQPIRRTGAVPRRTDAGCGGRRRTAVAVSMWPEPGTTSEALPQVRRPEFRDTAAPLAEAPEKEQAHRWPTRPTWWSSPHPPRDPLPGPSMRTGRSKERKRVHCCVRTTIIHARDPCVLAVARTEPIRKANTFAKSIHDTECGHDRDPGVSCPGGGRLPQITLCQSIFDESPRASTKARGSGEHFRARRTPNTGLRTRAVGCCTSSMSPR